MYGGKRELRKIVVCCLVVEAEVAHAWGWLRASQWYRGQLETLCLESDFFSLRECQGGRMREGGCGEAVTSIVDKPNPR